MKNKLHPGFIIRVCVLFFLVFRPFNAAILIDKRQPNWNENMQHFY